MRTNLKGLQAEFQVTLHLKIHNDTRAAVVHLKFRAGSTFPVPVCTVSPGHWVNNADTQ